MGVGDRGLASLERVVRAPLPRRDVGARLAVNEKRCLDLRYVGFMEIAPAVLPDPTALGAPSLIVAGKEELERLREARFARAVASDDQRQPWTRGESKLSARSDTAKTLNAHGVDVRASGIFRFSGFGGGRGRRFAAEAYLDLAEERREHELSCRLGQDDILLEAFEDV